MSDDPHPPPQAADETQAERLRTALRRVVLLKETGPKSAAWHRARVRTIWHLHELIARGQSPAAGGGSGDEATTDSDS
jgi:hypothetical protein